MQTIDTSISINFSALLQIKLNLINDSLDVLYKVLFLEHSCSQGKIMNLSMCFFISFCYMGFSWYADIDCEFLISFLMAHTATVKLFMKKRAKQNIIIRLLK